VVKRFHSHRALPRRAHQTTSANLFYGRGAGVGRGLGVSSALGVGVGLAVALGVAVAVAVAVAVVVGVAVGVGEVDWAQYLPPVFQRLISSVPPQTIISPPVSTAV
jgi:hypothetical protein